MNRDWYDTLIRPPLTPPDWIFGPVWTVLYAMIAASILWWAFRATDQFLRGRTWKVITLHLLANAGWTLFFFRLENPALALADILLLDATLVWILAVYRRECRPAWWLLLPYFFWVLFATYLNAGFWWLNR
jgi:tryptophan-rich sensory protein